MSGYFGGQLSQDEHGAQNRTFAEEVLGAVVFAMPGRSRQEKENLADQISEILDWYTAGGHEGRGRVKHPQVQEAAMLASVLDGRDGPWKQLDGDRLFKGLDDYMKFEGEQGVMRAKVASLAPRGLGAKLQQIVGAKRRPEFDRDAVQKAMGTTKPSAPPPSAPEQQATAQPPQPPARHKTVSIGEKTYELVPKDGIGTKPGTDEPHEAYEVRHDGEPIGEVRSYTATKTIKAPGRAYATRHEPVLKWQATLNQGHHKVGDEYNRDPETGAFRLKKGSHTLMELKSRKQAFEKMAQYHQD